MKKYVRVRMSDGVVYDIPAEIIAAHRADYFENNSAEKLTYHASSIQPRLRSAEMEFAMKNDDALLEWADKMEWKDLKDHAVKVEPEPKDYEKDWKTAKKQVISVSETDMP